MVDQLSFDWPTGVALGRDDFFVSEANAQAYAMISTPDTWPDRKLAIVGPHGCGKTHLAGIFAVQSHGEVISAATMTSDFRTEAQTVIVEDMDLLPKAAEEAMFHLHNHLRHTGGTLLMTATRAPSRWPIALPDLASRMQATTITQIANPDDALLSALIMKFFADRQISPKPELVTYLTSRIERSFAAASDIVGQLDATALAHGRNMTTKLARDLLDKAD